MTSQTLLNLSFASLIGLSLITQDAHAQSVEVFSSETGQGLLFQENGICYLLTAAHVSDGAPRLRLRTQAGLEASATMYAPFWQGFDLDIGTVNRLDKSACPMSFDQLAAGNDLHLAAATVTLPLVRPAGLENAELKVERVDYLEFSAKFTDPAMTGQKGMSGGFALLNGLPIGMARATGDAGQIYFIHMAEITMNLRRWLDRRATSAPEIAETASETAARAGISYAVLASSPAAISNDTMIEALVEGSGPFVYPSGKSAEIVLGNLSEGQKVITRRRVMSPPDPDHSQPRKIQIYRRAQPGGNFTYWKGADFPPDGLYDTGLTARLFASEIRIVLDGARDNKPVRIDQIIWD